MHEYDNRAVLKTPTGFGNQILQVSDLGSVARYTPSVGRSLLLKQFGYINVLGQAILTNCDINVSCNNLKEECCTEVLPLRSRL